MRDRSAESLDGLPREGAAAGVGQRAREHGGNVAAQLLGESVDRVERRLGVEGVEDRFDKQDIGAAVQKTARLLGVGVGQLAERHLAGRRIGHVGRDGGGAVGGSHRSGYEPGFPGVAGREFVGRTPGEGRRRARNLAGVLLQSVVLERNGVGVERIGGHDVGACRQVFFVDGPHRFGLCEDQQVVAAAQPHGPLAEPLAAVIFFGETVLLNHRAQPAVQEQDARFQELFERRGHVTCG